jgi:3'-phosphoadenosine 5'-phosphosulfate sulfotransferase (PAPS reductase)/FAD synthetase
MAKMKWMKKPKPELHVVSLSGGKDSTAMLLRMVEENMPIDIILFCDTGLEFPAMYAHLAKVERDIGMPITRIRSFHTFEYILTEKEILVKHKKNQGQRNYRGYDWSGPLNRWCTKELKTIPREKFLRELQEHYDIIEYVGLAADEGYRFERENNQKPNCRHPLVDWGMTEADCLKYCYDRGYTWDGLYEKFDRVSCWCCPLQPLAEMRVLYKEYPELWAKLKEWDKKTWRNFKADYSVEGLEARFDFEDMWQQQGKETNIFMSIIVEQITKKKILIFSSENTKQIMLVSL